VTQGKGFFCHQAAVAVDAALQFDAFENLPAPKDAR
jgi:hypothetical protein